MEKHQLIRKFDKQADKWDKRRRKRTIDTKWRKELLADARGRVLEIAVGAGGNFPFYNKNVHVTAVDFSPLMIMKAKGAAYENGIQAEFFVGDIEEMDFPERAFDTVVTTLSICAFSDPVQVLQRISRWCADDGYILMLEHGKSSIPVIAWIQNILDPLQFYMFGCHANRDITKLLSASPLYIEKHDRRLFNMVHLIWARPSQDR
jgi:ubiquinone/menaquinone biosynthesis C-methylase UbiE